MGGEMVSGKTVVPPLMQGSLKGAKEAYTA
jgi:hypothetical protein